jgi:hypothetical protein
MRRRGWSKEGELYCSPCIVSPRDTRTGDFALPRKYKHKRDDETSEAESNDETRMSLHAGE